MNCSVSLQLHSGLFENLFHLLLKILFVTLFLLVYTVLNLGKPSWQVKLIHMLANAIFLGRCKPLDQLLHLLGLALIRQSGIRSDHKLSSSMHEKLFELLGDDHVTSLEELEAHDVGLNLARVDPDAVT